MNVATNLTREVTPLAKTLHFQPRDWEFKSPSEQSEIAPRTLARLRGPRWDLTYKENLVRI